MPCNSDYLEPTSKERELQRAAKLLVYVIETCNRQHWPAYGGEIPSWLVETSQDMYAKSERPVAELCAKLKEMGPLVREKVIYNAHDPIARDLASWWEEHQAADSEREERETKAEKMRKLRLSALAKLTPEERKALYLE